jgi:uridine kinase
MTRFAVDGIDCAGKSTFADQLGELLGASRLSIDDFLRPRDERYARGELSGEGYYRDVRIWLEVPFDVALARALVRDAATMGDPRPRYEQRYWPGQRLYLEEVDPRSRADIVVGS